MRGRFAAFRQLCVSHELSEKDVIEQDVPVLNIEMFLFNFWQVRPACRIRPTVRLAGPYLGFTFAGCLLAALSTPADTCSLSAGQCDAE